MRELVVKWAELRESEHGDVPGFTAIELLKAWNYHGFCPCCLSFHHKADCEIANGKRIEKPVH